MKKIIEIKAEDAIKAYASAQSDEVKTVLKNLLGEENVEFKKENIKSYEDACYFNGREPYYNINKEKDTKDEIAYKMLKEISKAINPGYKPNWADTDEYKYYPWFEIKVPAGVGTAVDGSSLSVSVLTSSNVASYAYALSGGALASENRETAIYFGKQFAEIWGDYLLSDR